MQDGSSTPQWLFDALNSQLERLTGRGFELDAAASPWNAKCVEFFTEEINALTQDWSKWKTIFVNPPFEVSIIEQFAGKALDAAKDGSTVVLLLPSWPGYPWYQELKQKSHMQDVVGTVVFHQADGKPVPFCNGAKKTNISVFTLGPKIEPGTNGPAISRNGLSEPSASKQTGTNGGKLAHHHRHRLLSEIDPQPTEWLWHLRFPRGELSDISGDPGCNKSSMLLDLAARVSNGTAMPDGAGCESGGVLLLLAEDSIPKTVISRLKAAHADLSRIAVLDQHIRLPSQCATLQSAATQIRAKLIVIDPLMAFLEPDANGDQKVRQALTPLAALAEATNAAVVMVRHLNKRGGRNSLYRGSGSIGIIGAARSGLLIAKSPDDPDLRVLCHVKSNLGPLAPSLLFEPVDKNGFPLIEWRGECDYTADDLLASPPQGADRLTEAVAFLQEILADGPVKQKTVRQRAFAAGLAARTVERAKEVLRVVSNRQGFGPGSFCWWSLPNTDDSHSTPNDRAWRSMEESGVQTP